jgi:hypothetical protein
LLHAKAQLVQIALALHAPRRLARRLHGGQQQGEKHSNDRDYDQQLNQRHAVPSATEGFLAAV